MISFAQFLPEEGIPIYLQILRHVKRGIVSGAVADGDMLPSRAFRAAGRQSQYGTEGIPYSGGGGTDRLAHRRQKLRGRGRYAHCADPGGAAGG